MLLLGILHKRLIRAVTLYPFAVDLYLILGTLRARPSIEKRGLQTESARIYPCIHAFSPCSLFFFKTMIAISDSASIEISNEQAPSMKVGQ